MSAFLLTFKVNYLEKCVATLILLVDSNSPCKDLLFPHGPNLYLAQKPLYLSGTVLKLDFCTKLFATYLVTRQIDSQTATRFNIMLP